MRFVTLVLLSLLVVVEGTDVEQVDKSPQVVQESEPLVVAFLGDSLHSAEFIRDVLTPDILISPGNLAFPTSSTNPWLSLDIPYLAAVGEADLMDQYAAHLTNVPWLKQTHFLRQGAKRRGAECTGMPGALEVCHYRGLVTVNVIAGTPPGTTTEFLTSAFWMYPHSRWRVCNIHVPKKAPGTAQNPERLAHSTAVIKEACLQLGAMVADGQQFEYNEFNEGIIVPGRPSKKGKIKDAFNIMHTTRRRRTGSLNGRTEKPRLFPGSSREYKSAPELKSEYGKLKHFMEKKNIQPIPVRPNYLAVVCTIDPDGNSPEMAVCVYYTDQETRLMDVVVSHRLKSPLDYERRDSDLVESPAPAVPCPKTVVEQWEQIWRDASANAVKGPQVVEKETGHTGCWFPIGMFSVRCW